MLFGGGGGEGGREGEMGGRGIPYIDAGGVRRTLWGS